MLVTTLTENLSKALTVATRFTGGKVQLPVLANILLKTEKNKLVICATNLETSIAITIGAKVESEGSITVPGKTISDLVNTLPPGQMSLEEKEEKVLIKSASFESTVLGTNASDYPSIPEKGGGTTYSLPTTVLDDVLKKILFAVTTDETRPILTGVLLILKKQEIVFVSTDGFRLSHKSVQMPELSIEEEQRIIIPKNTLSELLRISSGFEDVKFSFNNEENQIVFLVGEYVLSSRIIQGDFPGFEKIIPKSPTVIIDIDKEELSRAVRLASVFARDSANVIKLNVLKSSVEVSSESAKSGNQKAIVDAKVEGGKELVIAYNYRFVEDFLNAVEGDSVELKLTDPSVPGIFVSPKDTNYFHIIMPIKLTS